MDSSAVVALFIALGTGLLGILLLYFAFRRRFRFVYTGTFIASLLLALAIVLVLVALFPDSSVSGNFEGFKVAGAIAAYLVVVVWLTRQGTKLIDKDSQVENYKTRIVDLEQQLAAAPKQPGQAPSRLSGGKKYGYRTEGRPRRTIGLIAGNLSEVRQVDVWVNSENTNMQMATYYDRSISGSIRYLGSRRGQDGYVKEDLIGDELREAVGGVQTVAAASVYATPPGELRDWGVKRVMHVAAVYGEPEDGYHPIGDIGRCVSRVLEQIDKENSKGGEPLRSVVFPLLGTGQARGKTEKIFPDLVGAALTHVQTRDTRISQVWFVTYNREELAICQRVLSGEDRLTAMGDARGAARS